MTREQAIALMDGAEERHADVGRRVIEPHAALRQERGVLMFAYNNEQIDYAQQALVNALMIRRNMAATKIALATDQGSFRWLCQNYSRALIDYAFDVLVFQETPSRGNLRVYRGGESNDALPFRNQNRASAFDLSPFAETIVVDTDYLIQDDRLDLCWDSVDEFMMNRKVVFMNHREGTGSDARLDVMGIPTYWATIMYFRRTAAARMVFRLVEHIRDNYDFYQHLYKFPGRFFRNDFAFSIALHMLNGFQEDGTFVRPLPVPHVYTSIDTDRLIAVPGFNDLVIESHEEGIGRILPVRLRDTSVHMMNKYAISAFARRFVELYAPEGIRIDAD